jgi:hypothetical protein
MTPSSEQLNNLARDVFRLSKLIDAPTDQLPTFGRSRDGGYPHIEFDQHGYHYVVIERGTEQERRTTRDPDELLYWIFEAITSYMAFQHELRHREAGRDPRRIAFPRQIHLLERLNPLWTQRRRLEIESILDSHPYDDEAIRRLDAMRERP